MANPYENRGRKVTGLMFITMTAGLPGELFRRFLGVINAFWGNTEVDVTWEELIMNARNMGMTIEDVRQFFNEQKQKSLNIVLENDNMTR